MKTCSKCKNSKQENEFHKNANYCKDCKKMYNAENKNSLSEKRKQYHLENRDRENSRNNQYYQINKEDRKKYYDSHKDHFHRYYIRSNYGSLDKQIKAVLVRCKKRAKQYEMLFDLDVEFVRELYTIQNGKCLLTDIDFDLEQPQEMSMRPFSMSIDRIDSTKDYTKDNVRLVCAIVNFAINGFGIDSFDKMCSSYCRKKNS